MTADRTSPRRRGESFDAFCARRPGSAPRAGSRRLRPKPGRRADHEPPDFEHEEVHALAWARQHCGCWKPEIVSYKRLEGGKTGVLIRDKLGSSITVVLDRGDVVDVDEAARFRRMEEVLQ